MCSRHPKNDQVYAISCVTRNEGIRVRETQKHRTLQTVSNSKSKENRQNPCGTISYIMIPIVRLHGRALVKHSIFGLKEEKVSEGFSV